MELGHGWSWAIVSSKSRRGARYVEPLVEVIDLEGARARVRVEQVAAVDASAVIARHLAGLAPATAPTLPDDLALKIDDARSEFGVQLKRGVFERWMDAIARGDEVAALAPLRDGTVPVNAILRTFGVAYTQVLMVWPHTDIASLVPRLVDLGADADAVDSGGQGSFHALLKRALLQQSHGIRPPERDGVPEAIDALVAAGARPRADARGVTPLHFLVGGPRPGGGWMATARALVRGGANPNAVEDYRGWTPLHTLIDSPWSDARGVELLIELGADPRRVDREGRTPYDIAQSRERDGGDRPISRVLAQGAPDRPSLERLAALVAREPERWQPPIRSIGVALARGDLPALVALLEDGVDPDGWDFRDASPLRVAREHRLAEAEAVLLAAGASRDEGPARIQWSEEVEARFAEARAALKSIAVQLAPPPRERARDLDVIDRETAGALRADPARAADRVGGWTLPQLAALYGLPQTLDAWLDVAGVPPPAELAKLLETALRRAALDSFHVLLRRGADPFDRGEFMSVFGRATDAGRVDAVRACIDVCTARKLAAREARSALKRLRVHGAGRSHYVAGFLRHLLLAIDGGIDGVSVDVRKRARNAPPDAWGASAYFQDVNAGRRSPGVAAVRAPLEAVIAARARGVHPVVRDAHRHGVPWVPRAEIAFRIGASPWTLLVAHGPRPESPQEVAQQLADGLGVAALSASIGGPVVHAPGQPATPWRVSDIDGFCREQHLMIPALEDTLDLGLVGLAVRGVVPDAVSEAAVVVVSPDTWMARSTPEERASIERLARTSPTPARKRR